MEGLDRCREHLHRKLIDRGGLQSVAIAADMAQVDGILRGRAVRMTSQRYTGPGFAALTIACITTPTELTAAPSGLADAPSRTAGSPEQAVSVSLTVVGLPWPGSGLPILGMDLIALRGSLSLLAIDLAPTDHDLFQARCAPSLLRLQNRVAEAVVPRRPPAFTQGTFSSLALIAAARPGSEAVVFDAILRFIDEAAELACSAWPEPPDLYAATQRDEAAIARWLAAERQNRREHNALSQIFGEPFAERYLHGFLFVPPPPLTRSGVADERAAR